MAKAKLIVPAHYIKPRCEAKLTEQATVYKIRRRSEIINDLKVDDCRNQASIHIDGKDLCRKHAAMMALDILLKKGEAES